MAMLMNLAEDVGDGGLVNPLAPVLSPVLTPPVQQQQANQLPPGFSPWAPFGTYATTNPDSLQYVGNNQGGYSDNPDAQNYHPYASLLNALAAGQSPTTGWMESYGPGMDSAQVYMNPDGTMSDFALHSNNDNAFWNAALAATLLTGANVASAAGSGAAGLAEGVGTADGVLGGGIAEGGAAGAIESAAGGINALAAPAGGWEASVAPAFASGSGAGAGSAYALPSTVGYGGLGETAALSGVGSSYGLGGISPDVLTGGVLGTPEAVGLGSATGVLGLGSGAGAAISAPLMETGGALAAPAVAASAPELGAAIPAASIIPGISDSALLGGGLALGGALINSNAANNATDALIAANNASNATQRYIFDTIRADNQPLVDLRNSVLPKINALLASPSSVTSDPGYAFGLNEGRRLLESGAAARGMTYSGDQGKALLKYGNDYAGTQLDKVLNRYTTTAGLGQVGSNNNQTAATNYGNNVSSAQQNIGNANASGYIAGGNAWGNALGQFGNYLQFQNLLNRVGG